MENSLNTKVKEKDPEKGIKCEENTYDVKIKHEYNVPVIVKSKKVKVRKRILKLK